MSKQIIFPQEQFLPQRLANFIRANTDAIIEEWISFARTRTPASHTMTTLALQDHIVELLTFVADDIETAQSDEEQSDKSKGLGDPSGQFTQSAAEIHAALRLEDGFDIDQLVSEYRALRASVIKLWTGPDKVLAHTDLEDMIRFNEAIDQALAESVAEYTKIIDESRNLFLGVLGHDLRNPIGSAWMTAKLITKINPDDSKQAMLAGQIATSMDRATHILNDLLEITRSAFGTEIPLVRVKMEMGELAEQLVAEMRIVIQKRKIKLSVTGDTYGAWDRDRMGQVFSNLIGNAAQYSPEDSVITVIVTDQGEDVLVSVHNRGTPIPVEKQKTIFEALTRATGNTSQGSGSTNLGLGLFIANKIVTAHNGKLSVHSTLADGTTFSFMIPKGSGE